LHARRLHPALEPTRQIPRDVGLSDACYLDAGVVAAVAGVDDDALAPQPWAGLAHLLLLAQQNGTATPRPRRQLTQRAHRGRAAAAVGPQPVGGLEGPQRQL